MLSLMISESDKWVEKINKLSAQDIYQLVQILIRHNSFSTANDILKCILITKELNHTISKNILTASALILDAELENAIVEHYIRIKNKYYLEYLKTNSKNWRRVNDMLISKLSAVDDDRLLIEYHLYNKEVKKAAAIISNSNSWEVLQQFDSTIVELSQEKGLKLYLDYTLHYLQDHFGTMAAQHLEIVLIRARRLGSEKWVRKINTQIKTAFPHRAF